MEAEPDGVLDGRVDAGFGPDAGDKQPLDPLRLEFAAASPVPKALASRLDQRLARLLGATSGQISVNGSPLSLKAERPSGVDRMERPRLEATSTT